MTGDRPSVESGYALKRLRRDAGAKRWSLGEAAPLRLSENDAELFELLNGEHSLLDLVGEAERRFGPNGAARLERLIAALQDRGYLAAAKARRPRGTVVAG